MVLRHGHADRYDRNCGACINDLVAAATHDLERQALRDVPHFHARDSSGRFLGCYLMEDMAVAAAGEGGTVRPYPMPPDKLVGDRLVREERHSDGRAGLV